MDEAALLVHIRNSGFGTRDASFTHTARLRFIVFSQVSTGGAARSWAAPLFDLIWHDRCSGDNSHRRGGVELAERSWDGIASYDSVAAGPDE